MAVTRYDASIRQDNDSMICNSKTSPCTTADDVLDIFKSAPDESFTVRKIASRIKNIPVDKVDLNDCGIIYAKISNLRKSRSIKLDGLVPNGGYSVLSYSLRI